MWGGDGFVYLCELGGFADGFLQDARVKMMAFFAL